MNIATIGARSTRHMRLEKDWLYREMKTDELFCSLVSTRRDHTYIGRNFLAWTMVQGCPIINTLFEVERFGINERGLYVTFGIARPNVAGIERIRVTNHPLKLRHLDLYLWLPYFAEVRNVPIDASDPASRRRTSVPLLFKHRHRPDTGQIDGYPYFSSKGDFLALWPEHAF